MDSLTTSSLAGSNILSADQFDLATIDLIFRYARRMPKIARRDVRNRILDGFVGGVFFFEESTRTRLSTELAFYRLGANVVSMIDPKFSSMVKGESYADAVAFYAMYCDIMVIRHPEEGRVAEAAAIADVPVINAGDGPGEHPTQGLLDLFTLHEACDQLRNVRLALAGDLLRGRTVHSLCKLLCLFDSIAVDLIAPDEFQLPDELVSQMRRAGLHVTVTSDFEAGVREADAIYMVRPQINREPVIDLSLLDYIQLTRAFLDDRCRADVKILHPMPRTGEIAIDVDTHPGAVYKKVRRSTAF
ncbi:aspartate carbamoyltransferase [bacterium]|nr:aspartate carbamoyltransferase [bacterium]